MKNNFKKWIKAAGIRAIKTVAQSAIATIGTSAFMGDVNWVLVGSASLLAGILSLLTSVAGLPEVDNNPEGMRQLDGATITLIVGIVTCVIGVASFVGSLQNKAQNTGILQQKLEQALQGIEEIKKQVEKSNIVQSNLNLQITSHSEQIKSIYKTK